ncbi:hypothetical protein SEPCBS119000_000864 [Sporothrix epigloea]|uniref:Uncharacterized protein n=1 Tax=Sporothrix epigloea TaxID=1892477 RepID=A0ABP0DAF6_9PEZI
MSVPDVMAEISLVHAADGIGYRLLELPAELVDDHAEWSLSSSADGLAQLHAAGRTYALRQKNTSNALVLLKESGDAPRASEPSSPATSSLRSNQSTVSVIATVHETVELVEVKQPTSNPAPKPSAAPARGKWHEKFGQMR